MTAEGTALWLGRDAGCDVVVDEHHVSRTHARIGFERGKFLLEDQSTNGTYVLTHDHNVVYLRRERLPLWGDGTISLGRPLAERTALLIHYRCD